MKDIPFILTTSVVSDSSDVCDFKSDFSGQLPLHQESLNHSVRVRSGRCRLLLMASWAKCFTLLPDFFFNFLTLYLGVADWGFPGGVVGEESTCRCRRCKRRRLDPWVGKIPWSRKWHPAPEFLLYVFKFLNSVSYPSILLASLYFGLPS